MTAWRFTLLVGLGLFFPAGLPSLHAASEAWTQSQVIGSPEPPYLALAQRVYPLATFKEPVEVGSFPRQPWLHILESNGRWFGLKADDPQATPRLLADFRTKYPQMGPAYSFTFHPGFETNRQVFFCLITADGTPDGSRISRFLLPPGPDSLLDLQSEQVIITWPGGGHNAGSIQFGADGMLYIATGDSAGPSPPDPLNTGQDISDLLSSILRIDVDHPAPGKAYSIPPNNPFVQIPNARPEVWAYGLRNPWKISIQPGTSIVWAGDVGWELWEMIFRIASPGFNGGWSIIESRQPVKPGNPRGPTPISPPLTDHSHDEAASITGGIFYRDHLIPELQNSYIYGDWETGKMWSLRETNGVLSEKREIADTPLRIVGFGEGPHREFYFIDHAGGGVYRLSKNPASGQPSRFPRQLSRTGLFASTPAQTPAPGVQPFEVVSPLWTEGTHAQRWIGIPSAQPFRFVQDYWLAPRNLTPTNTVLARTVQFSASNTTYRIETQLLHYNGDGWNAYTYRWRDDQSDADLVPPEGVSATLILPSTHNPAEYQSVRWRFHSRAECLRCHNTWNGTTLGFNPAQLATSKASPPATSSPISAWERLRALGMVESPAQSGPKLADPWDLTLPLEDRARSYLHANCGHCHRNAAGGSVLVMLNLQTSLKESHLIGAKPVQGDLGVPHAELIAPGDPLRSLLLYRLAKSGSGHMPHLGSVWSDPRALALISDWIASMDNPSRESPLSILKATTEWFQARRESAPTPIWASHAQSPASALALRIAVAQLQASHPWTDTHAQGLLQSLPPTPSPLVRDLLNPLLPIQAQRQTLGPQPDPQSILSLRGRSERGAELFSAAHGAQCSRCHAVLGRGGGLGPDLTAIARKYAPADLLTHILKPSQSVEPAYAAWTVETIDGETHTGRWVERTNEKLVLWDGQSQQHVWKPNEVRSMNASSISLMPEGLLQGLTAQEAADLLAFLLQPL